MCPLLTSKAHDLLNQTGKVGAQHQAEAKRFAFTMTLKSIYRGMKSET